MTPWREWKYMTGRQIDAVPRDRAVVLLTVSPLEVHGPHLPVITDNMEGEGLLRRTAERMLERHPEIQFLHLPPIYTAADVLPHVGSLMFRSSTIQRTLEDLGRSLAAQGFRHLWISSFHGGPRHFVPIEVACHNTNRRYGASNISVFSALLGELTGGSSDLADVLGHVDGVDPHDLVGDSHGGVIETSMMLYLLGEHVDPVWAELGRRTVEEKLAAQGKEPLNETDPTLRDLIRGFKEKIKYYEDETYAGRPEMATPELGRAFIDVLAGHCAEALSAVWTGQRKPEDCHSPLWPVRWAFTVRALGWLFERAVKYRHRVW
ncbi:MAG: creatininase family protein [Alphaproteobacteria bacterium]|nr:creatininase family protein [Alphaproteobacteria bacterium]